jgi:hypothetical protein
MLIIALVLALIGLVALVFAVVTSNELVAWVCIGASVLGVVLLIVDAIRERQQRDVGDQSDEGEPDEAVDYPDEVEQDPQAGNAGGNDTGVAEDAGSDATEESTVSADRSRDESAK